MRPPFPMVVGMPRSGTTMLHGMLDSHPELAVVNESYIPVKLHPLRERYETSGGFDLGRFASDLLDDPEITDFRQYWKLPENLVRERIAGVEPIDYADAMRRLYALYAEFHGKPRYGDKTPSFVLHIDLLKHLFPEARFVHIIRDGRNVALSLVEVHFGPDDVLEAGRQWTRIVRRARSWGRELGPERYLEVRYESLATDPEPDLKTVCEFLELDYDARMLRAFLERRRNPPPRVRARSYDVDRRLRDWRHEMSRADLVRFDRVAGRLLTDLGYERADLRVRPLRAASSRADRRGSPAPHERRLIFIDVPLTLPPAMRAALVRQYGPQGFARVRPDQLRDLVERLDSLPAHDQERLRCFWGPMPFGLHEYLRWPATYTTFLRDPVERIVSHYEYSRAVPTARFHREIVSEGLGLQQYVERSSASPAINNAQTRLLGSRLGEPFRVASEDMLDAAKRNIDEHFVVVGLVERLAESFVLLRRSLRWPSRLYAEAAVPPRSSTRELQGSVRGAIEERNRLDIALYRYAEDRLERQIREAGVAFAVEARAVRLGKRLQRRKTT